MLDKSHTKSAIIDAYRERTATSEALASRTQQVLPGGIVHDSLHLDPYSISVNREAEAASN